MKLNTQKVVYLGVLGLAAVAFAADRWFFSPAAASAQTVTQSQAAGSNAAGTPKIAVATIPQDSLAGLASLSQRLQTAADSDGVDLTQVKDAFRPSTLWVSKPETSAKGVTTADHFRSQHQLLAVMSGTRGGIAIINGKTVRRGQTIDGFRLTSVRERSAVFENTDGVVELALTKESDASTDNAVVRAIAPGNVWGGQ